MSVNTNRDKNVIFTFKEMTLSYCLCYKYWRYKVDSVAIYFIVLLGGTYLIDGSTISVGLPSVGGTT
jgi:hypothetical protein